jgi:putative colanic acid biosynthesis UDP-glucose lipid carrier transferase
LPTDHQPEFIPGQFDPMNWESNKYVDPTLFSSPSSDQEIHVGKYHKSIPAKYSIVDGLIIVLTNFLIDFFYDQMFFVLYWPIMIVTCICFYFCSLFTAIYRHGDHNSFATHCMKITLTWVSTTFLLFLFAFASKTTEQYSRIVFINWFISVPACICLWHYFLFKHNFLTEIKETFRAIIVGKDKQGVEISNLINQRQDLNFKIYGFYDREAKEDQYGSLEREYHRTLGNLDDLVDDAKSGSFHLVYLNLPFEDKEAIYELTQKLSDSTVSVYFMIPKVLSSVYLTPNFHQLDQHYAISIFESPFTGREMLIKRIEDILLSLFIIILISPLLCLTALAVKLTSRGPVLFKQKRYGMSGKPFGIYKFRSMTVQENDKDVKQAVKHDPRLTAIGGLLRKYSIDELPQFFNVLLGEMSIVGPRPHANVHNEFYRKRIQGYMLRHKVLPGITGLAQINGCRGITDTEEKMERRIRYDLKYIKDWSVALDLQIIVSTAFKVFHDPKAL